MNKISFYVLITFFCFLPQLYWSQVIHYANRASGNQLDEGNGIAVDYIGNTYITGRFESASLDFGNSILINNSTSDDYTDIFIAKFSPSGQCIWAVSVGGDEDDYGAAITLNNNGEVYVTGYFQSTSITFASQTIVNAGNTDIFVLKINNTGTPQWIKGYGGSSDEQGAGISCDHNGNIYFTGYFYSSSINFGDGPLSNSGGKDIFLAKINSLGITEWSQKFGGADDDQGMAIKADMAGNCYVTGVYESATVSFGLYVLNNAESGSKNLFIVKLDTSGNMQWAKHANASANDDVWGNAIDIDAVGNCYVSGCFDGTYGYFESTTLTNSHTGYDNVFTCKYDALGNFQWATNPVSGPEGNEAYCVAADKMGNSYISGWYTSPTLTFSSITLSSSAFGDNIFLAHYNTNGQLEHAYSFSGTGFSGGYGNAICADSLGHVFLTGYFEGSNMKFGNTTLLNTGSWDVYWTKISMGFASLPAMSESQAHAFYPNPVMHGVVVFKVVPNHIKLFTLDGKILYENAQPNTFMDVSFLSQGAYFIYLTYPDFSMIEKVIVGN